MAVTIKDVALKAKVSTATVSLVINGNNRISPETKRKVLKVIKELDYHPSKSARDLVSQKTGNIGFLLTDDHFLRTEPFYTRIFLGSEFEAGNTNYYILLATVPSTYNNNNSLPRFILERSIDGLIVAGKVPEELLSKLSEYKLPLTFVDYKPERQKYPVVLIDNIHGGLLATNHLIEYGHKKIAFIGGDISHPSIRDRLTGYTRALDNAGINFNKNIIHTISPYPDRQNGYDAAKSIFTKNKNITAVFACNDAMAIGVMHYLKDNGYSIPDDVSIIGFDDVEADLLLDPPLSTIRVPKFDLGAEAFKIMKESIQNKETKSKIVLVPVELIIRKSTRKI
ncbi:MAG: LacI family transcriptional regulator [Melioribacteraceae bacterium]|nr:LacI family transcriptional regulator [Melioribacteraceae bacterium]MCF8354261.1 LacI family transcriptional regulator [Melioribacteraceae bacterium]MCF8396258.1 LacI family transcriptional regulator [Melioribacteraceae bacterium]MCF8419724.1 LacI family transcriptional regulator [Melioribacteraceae bacterium]